MGSVQEFEKNAIARPDKPSFAFGAHEKNRTSDLSLTKGVLYH